MKELLKRTKLSNKIDWKKREVELIEFIESNLKDFKNMIDEAKSRVGEKPSIVFHQDAFVCDYQEDEYVLLGKAIKYAGSVGVDIHIIGKNGSAFNFLEQNND